MSESQKKAHQRYEASEKAKARKAKYKASRKGKDARLNERANWTPEQWQAHRERNRASYLKRKAKKLKKTLDNIVCGTIYLI